jgi:hypothetical protein
MHCNCVAPALLVRCSNVVHPNGFGGKELAGAGAEKSIFVDIFGTR